MLISKSFSSEYADMKKIRAILILFCGLMSLLAMIACQDNILRETPELSKWQVVPRPEKQNAKKYYDFFHRANWSQIKWVVSVGKGGVVKATLAPTHTNDSPKLSFPTEVVDGINRFKEPYRCLRVDDGWLVAFNHGEWGGAIYWWSSDGKKRYKISNHQVNQFFTDKGQIYAVEGLAHLTLSRGSMITIKKVDGIWKAHTFVDLLHSGNAISVLESGDFVVVTTDTLLRVHRDKTLSVLVSMPYWGMLALNSVAIEKDRFVYVGMRQFVARYDLKDGKQTLDFLLPDFKLLNTKTDVDRFFKQYREATR